MTARRRAATQNEVDRRLDMHLSLGVSSAIAYP
jgi:hypothetical protein